MLFLVIAIIGAGISAAIAADKGRNAFGWALVGALLPLITIIILVAMPRAEQLIAPGSQE